MRPVVLVSALSVTLVASSARAQTPTTADGVAALVRGDVGLAAEILRPIAEDWRRDDPGAAFFLATMYETGRGVPLDPLRACALYQRSMGGDDTVYMPVASRLTRTLLFSHDQAWRDDCTVTQQVGTAHRFEPQTMTFAAGQTVEWSIGGATISYNQVSARFPFGSRARGAVYLPLQKTDLRVAGSIRHFVQVAFWEPSATTWTLHWSLYEIDRGELRQAGRHAPLAHATGREPTDVDLEKLVAVRVNDRGQPEVALQTPAGPRIVPIPPSVARPPAF
jgi:hypothetical protein